MSISGNWAAISKPASAVPVMLLLVLISKIAVSLVSGRSTTSNKPNEMGNDVAGWWIHEAWQAFMLSKLQKLDLTIATLEIFAYVLNRFSRCFRNALSILEVSYTKTHVIYGNPWDTLNDVITSAMPSQITNLTIIYAGVCSGADQRKNQSSASLAFVRGIHR